MSIIQDISSGNHDDNLRDIILAAQGRTKTLSNRKVQDLDIQPGDEVRFSNSIRPKYLIGKTAKVVKLNSKSVVIDCPADPSYGRFENSKGVRCPNSVIEGLV